MAATENGGFAGLATEYGVHYRQLKGILSFAGDL